METEFWGVEVKRGEPLKVSPGHGMILHLSQASLGEHKSKKEKESVSLFVNVDGKNLVLGTLITNKLPQHQFDLLFDREFELSHDWEGGSVYFYGYKASNSLGEDELLEGESDIRPDESDFDFEDEEDIPLNIANNGKPKSNDEQVKPELKVEQEQSESSAEQQKPEPNAEQEKTNSKEKWKKRKPNSKAEQETPELKAEQQKPEPNAEQEEADSVRQKKRKAKSKVKQDKPAEVERCDTPIEESDAGKDSVKIAETRMDVNPQDDDESTYEDLMSDDDEEHMSQVSSRKKRVKRRKKKAKVLLPHENDGDKAAPLPENEAAQTPIDQANKQTPKSGKAHTCKICNKSFSTELGLESHTKVKHGDGK